MKTKKFGSSFKDLAEQMRLESAEELPAVELHMFPEKPVDVDSCTPLQQRFEDFEVCVDNAVEICRLCKPVRSCECRGERTMKDN